MRVHAWVVGEEVEWASMGQEGRWYRFRVFATRYTIPMVWLWAGTMMCGLGTVYYRLKRGEDVTSK